MPRLIGSLAAFAILTAASAGSFLGQVKARPWRGWAHLATAAMPVRRGFAVLAAPQLITRSSESIYANSSVLGRFGIGLGVAGAVP